MKKKVFKTCISILSILFTVLAVIPVHAQDSVKIPLVISLSYFSGNNKFQYLTVNVKSKATGKFEPVPGVEIKLYLKDTAGKPDGFIGKVITDEKGKAATNIPPVLAQVWRSSKNHTFIATTDKAKGFDATNTEITIAKAQITIDTADDKNIIVTFSEYKDQRWIAVKGVELKIGIKRLGGDLQINDDQSYTTDSSGQVKAEFKKIGIPGDAAGNILLVAKVEDNDTYGNLRIERSEPWGSKLVTDKGFFHRALWASRFHSPVWLVVMAYSILISVWGILIYLVFLLIKMRKIGRQKETHH